MLNLAILSSFFLWSGLLVLYAPKYIHENFILESFRDRSLNIQRAIVECIENHERTEIINRFKRGGVFLLYLSAFIHICSGVYMIFFSLNTIFDYVKFLLVQLFPLPLAPSFFLTHLFTVRAKRNFTLNQPAFQAVVKPFLLYSLLSILSLIGFSVPLYVLVIAKLYV